MNEAYLQGRFLSQAVFDFLQLIQATFVLDAKEEGWGWANGGSVGFSIENIFKKKNKKLTQQINDFIPLNAAFFDAYYKSTSSGNIR